MRLAQSARTFDEIDTCECIPIVKTAMEERELLNIRCVRWDIVDIVRLGVWQTVDDAAGFRRFHKTPSFQVNFQTLLFAWFKVLFYTVDW